MPRTRVSHAFPNLRAASDAAEHLAERHGLGEVPDSDLPAHGEPGALELISRCAPRLAALVQRAARANAAEREDLEQAAMLGVLESLPRYNATHGTEPFTYARSYVVNALAAANRTSQAVPTPQSAHDRFWAAMAACANDSRRAREWSRLQRLTGYELLELVDAGNDLAADIMDARIARWERRGQDVDAMLGERGRGLEPAEFDAIHSALMYVSVDAPEHDAREDDAPTLAETVACPSAQTAYAEVEDRETVACILAGLESRERFILARHYGIGGVQLTDSEIAAELGISRTRVVNLRTKLVRQLAARHAERVAEQSAENSRERAAA